MFKANSLRKKINRPKQAAKCSKINTDQERK